MAPEIIIVPAMFFSFVAIIKIISDKRVKRLLIEKGRMDDSVKYFNEISNGRRNPLTAIKWGLVLVGLGLALLVGQFFPYTVSDEITISLMFLFAGAGFLAYYFIARSRMTGDAPANEQHDA